MSPPVNSKAPPKKDEERVYKYTPPDCPVLGGYAANIPDWVRKDFINQAISSGVRVTRAEPYQRTGDTAFDLRVSAFREVLKRGTREAMKESHEAFMAVGL